ncbi:MAG: DUF4835 family protein [Bacteroidales bacterium]
MIKKYGLSIAFFLSMAFSGFGQQEMNCMISISTPGLSETEREIMRTLQTDLREFINQRNWTDYQFQTRERIEASILITVSERIGSDEYRGTIQVQSRRPVYQTSYSSPVFNHQDRDLHFRYIENQPLDYVDNVFTSNLTSIIAYYIYIIIGFDFDSFGPMAGTPYFERAQNIVNTAQNTAERGWKSFESQRNRYWLVENLFNPTYRNIRQAMYIYHRQGFDTMAENMDVARGEVITALEMLQRVQRERPGSFLMQVVMTSKSDELVNLFSQAPQMDRSRAISILTEIDPSNSAKYRRMEEQGR